MSISYYLWSKNLNDAETWIELNNFSFSVKSESGLDTGVPAAPEPAEFGAITVAFEGDQFLQNYLDSMAEGDRREFFITAVTNDPIGGQQTFYQLTVNGAYVSEWYDGLGGNFLSFDYQAIQVQTRYFDYRGTLHDDAPFAWDVKNNDELPELPFGEKPDNTLDPFPQANLYFAKIDGLDGYLADGQHDGWFEVLDFDISGAIELIGDKSAVPSFAPVRVYVGSEAGLTQLLNHAAAGSEIEGLVLEGGGSDSFDVYHKTYELTLGGLTVASLVNYDGPGYEVTLGYEYIQLELFDSDGTSAGEKHWNILTNKADGTPPTVDIGSNDRPDLPAQFFLAIEGLRGDVDLPGHEGWFQVDVNTLAHNTGGERPEVTVTFNSETEAGDLLAKLYNGKAFAATLHGMDGADKVYQIDLGKATIDQLFNTSAGNLRINFDYDQFELSTWGRDQFDDLLPDPEVFSWDFAADAALAGGLASATPLEGKTVPPTIQATKFYMVVDGMNGGSNDPAHLGWFELDSFGAIFSGIAAEDFSPVSVSLGRDTGLAAMMEAAFAGADIGGVRIQGVADVGGVETKVYELGLTDVAINLVTENSNPGYYAEFDYGRIAVRTYDPATGKLQSAGGWDRILDQPNSVMPKANAATGDSEAQAVRYFLAMNGVAGGSEVKGHESWLELDNFGFTLEHSTNEGVAAGLPQMSELSFAAGTDTPLPVLLHSLSAGTRIDGAAVRGLRFGEGIDPELVYQAELRDVLVKSVYDPSYTGFNATLDFAAIELTTKLQDGLTGEITGENKTGWDFIAKSAAAFDVSPVPAKGPAFRPDHFYLAIDGILGDNLSVERGGWFDVLDYSIGFDNTGTAKVAGGGGEGKAEFGNLNITIDSDYGLAALLDAIGTGGAIDSLVIQGTIDDGTGTETLASSLAVADAYVESIRDNPGGGYIVSLAFEKISYGALSGKEMDNWQVAGWDLLANEAYDENIAAVPGATRYSDLITGTEFDDVLAGAAGADQIRGGDGDDQINGGLGRDRLFGGTGNDNLKGGSGGDLLRGETGLDVLTGGVNKDTFFYGRVADSRDGKNRDVITDFNFNDGDVIDLRRVTKADLAWVNGGPFTGINQVTSIDAPDNPGFDTIVQINLTGDATPEMEIRLNKISNGSLLETDFLL